MNNANSVPFLDLVAPHVELEHEIIEVFRQALRGGSFIGGPAVEGFEEDFASFCGTRHCVGVGSGTDALRFALIASGIRPGETVITVPNTFIATTEAITQAGAIPAFVDVDEATCNMDPEKLREFIETQCLVSDNRGRPVNFATGSPVAAVVPVHLYGQCADMDAIKKIADRYNLLVIEDACQAHGARYFSTTENRWMTAGTMGLASAFSFYPGKNLGACGEGGAVTTESDDVARTVRMLRDHGQIKKYFHEIEGYNGRLDAVQAAILKVKLKHLRRWNSRRREAARSYRELLIKDSGVVLPFEPQWSEAVYHLFVIRVSDRDGLQGCLKKNNFSTGLHYPVPLHLQKAYESMGYRQNDMPVAEKAASEVLSLPMYPELKREQQEKISAVILKFLDSEKCRSNS